MTRPDHTLFGVMTLGTLCCLIWVGGWVLIICAISNMKGN